MSRYCSSVVEDRLASGNFFLTELYEFTLTTGQTYRFTGGQTPLPSVDIYLPPSTIEGPYAFQTGLVLVRGDINFKVGVEGGTMSLRVVPVMPTPPNTAIPTFNGYTFTQAARNGFLDDAIVRMSVLVLEIPVPPAQLDTSGGAIGFLEGVVDHAEVNRFYTDLTINDYLVFMNTQQMPRTLEKVGCNHVVYDPGCSLLESAFTVTGTVTSATDGAHFDSNLTQADHYFELGIVTMHGNVTPALAGVRMTVSSYLHASGALVMKFPFPKKPSAGDLFDVVPGCDGLRQTCISKFNNLAHYAGSDFVPDPSTMVDGGTTPPVQNNVGGQAGLIIGSAPTATGIPTGKYAP